VRSLTWSISGRATAPPWMSSILSPTSTSPTRRAGDTRTPSRPVPLTEMKTTARERHTEGSRSGLLVGPHDDVLMGTHLCQILARVPLRPRRPRVLRLLPPWLGGSRCAGCARRRPQERHENRPSVVEYDMEGARKGTVGVCFFAPQTGPSIGPGRRESLERSNLPRGARRFSANGMFKSLN
jgi:hypothetical protein